MKHFPRHYKERPSDLTSPKVFFFIGGSLLLPTKRTERDEDQRETIDISCGVDLIVDGIGEAPVE